MALASRGLIAETLFVGATRPPMRWGVTYTALLFNLVFTLEAFLLTRNLLTLLIWVPVHGLSALLCARDARCFDLLLLWARTRLPHGGRRSFPGTVGYAALRVELPNARGRRPQADALPRLWDGGRRQC